MSQRKKLRFRLNSALHILMQRRVVIDEFELFGEQLLCIADISYFLLSIPVKDVNCISMGLHRTVVALDVI